MADDLLNNEDYIKILQTRFKTENIDLISAEMKVFSENIQGFMGDHYNLALTYKIGTEEKLENFFIKTKPRKSYQNETASHIYVKEVYLYEILLKEFEKLNFYTGFAPKCFYIKDADIIVMENLLENGFKLFERNHFFDVNHCKVSLKALAYLHANTIAYEEMKSKELGRIFRTDEENPVAFKPVLFREDDSKGKLFINSGIECFIKMSQLIDKSEEWKNSFKKKIKDIDCAKIFNKPIPYKTTCTHGDLWSNNMLFKYEAGVPVQCTLVDFQIIRHFHPAYDVLLILYSNTSREFRMKHQEELIDYYYFIFRNVLKEHGLDYDKILTRKDFLYTIQHFKPVALIQAACTRTIVRLPLDFTNSSVESKESFETLMFKKERADVAVIGFEKDENFRSVMSDDIYDLDEHL